MRARRAALVVKRLMDIAVAAVGLVVLAPVFVLVGLGAALCLGRPLLYRQQRPGRNESPFTILKFRSMTDRVDSAGKALPDADRLGRFGRVLRATSLDEIPQLINVLRGEMSLVGPRPLLCEYLPLYSDVQRRRHVMRPGITGWSQVNGRNLTEWPEHLSGDVWYVDNWSLWLDCKILLKTIGVVVLPARRLCHRACNLADVHRLRGSRHLIGAPASRERQQRRHLNPRPV